MRLAFTKLVFLFSTPGFNACQLTPELNIQARITEFGFGEVIEKQNQIIVIFKI